MLVLQATNGVVNKTAWRIYYDDFSVFGNDFGEPEDAPAYGVLHIVFYDDSGTRLILSKFDYYYYKNQQWWGSDLTGLLDQFTTFPRECRALKIGRTVSTEIWRQTHINAAHDEDFPV